MSLLIILISNQLQISSGNKRTYLNSLVTPGLGAAIHNRRFSKRSIKDDLPTFGQPTMPARTCQRIKKSSKSKIKNCCQGRTLSLKIRQISLILDLFYRFNLERQKRPQLPERERERDERIKRERTHVHLPVLLQMPRVPLFPYLACYDKMWYQSFFVNFDAIDNATTSTNIEE